MTSIFLYIDPGTGSMLFAILIGIIGALQYVIRMGVMKLKFILSGGKTDNTTEKGIPYVIFSDDKRYWNVFKPICEEFDKRGIDVVYMTASKDDPALNNEFKHIKGEFIGEGNKAFAKLNFLKATILISTTPGLDVYQWKKSKTVKYYVHVLHAAGEVVQYRMFGLDYYDMVIIAGDHEEKSIRKLEKLRNLPEKELKMGGIPYMDEMVKRLKAAEPIEKKYDRTVLLAPSWGESAIFKKFGGKIIEELLKTGYHVIVRPHPQSFTSEKDMIERIMSEYPASDQLEWNRDNDNFDVLRKSDILISDYSGVIFDFSLVYDKPVIYADTKFDRAPYDVWWLGVPLWTEEILPKIGMKLTEESINDIKSIIDTCINEQRFADGRDLAREQSWQPMGVGTVKTVDAIVDKYKELTSFDDAGEDKKEK